MNSIFFFFVFNFPFNYQILWIWINQPHHPRFSNIEYSSIWVIITHPSTPKKRGKLCLRFNPKKLSFTRFTPDPNCSGDTYWLLNQQTPNLHTEIDPLNIILLFEICFKPDSSAQDPWVFSTFFELKYSSF